MDVPVSTTNPAGRHRQVWRKLGRNTPVLWLSALLVVVLVAWGSVAGLSAYLGSSDCSQPVTARIAAAPNIAEAVAEVARTTVKPDACERIDVLARDSASMADALANPPAEALPDAWIPESTYWLRRARQLGAFEAPDRGTPVASSPVVLAVTEPVAAQFGAPQKPLAWSSLLAPDAPAIAVGVPDPATDPVGVSALIAVKNITSAASEPAAADVAALRRISPYAVTRASDLYQRLPGTGSTEGTLNAFVTSEQALVRYNTRQQVVSPLVAAYPDQPLPTLDFPYVVLPGSAGPARTAATRFLRSLLASAAQPTFGAQGFRGPDGKVLPGRPDRSGARDDQVPPVGLPDDDSVVALLNTWTGVHLSARLLGVIDISGSMAERLPGGTETRLSAAIKAAQEGAGLLLDSTTVSVWVFATQLEGNRDYRVVFPPRQLGNGGRAALINALGQVKAKPDGNTGLYDTVLAAYQEGRRSWTPGQINLLLVTTDGKNDDPGGGISRAQLLAELGKLQDPRRPLPILFIGLSGGVDPGELTDIANVTGGKVYVTKDPSGIRQIFFDALSSLACQPPACRR